MAALEKAELKTGNQQWEEEKSSLIALLETNWKHPRATISLEDKDNKNLMATWRKSLIVC